MTVLPNPTNQVLHIKTSDEIQNLSVIDILGNVKMVKTIKNGQLDVGSLETGIYFVRVQTSHGVATKQFIKQ